MKNIKIFILSLLCLAGLSACMPEEYELGPVDVTVEELVQGLAYTVIQDAEDPNTIYLESLMKGYTPLWEHPQGKSQEMKLTLKIPFKGDYTVKFGVQTAGGFIYGEPYTFTLTTDNLSYVDDPVWNMISGGPGKSKTWVLDLDADGVARKFMGPKWFFTSYYCWDNLHMPDGTTYLDGAAWDPAAAIVPNLTDGAATWYWTADYAGNSWMCEAADFGTMTFDLINGANVTVDQEAYGIGKLTGSYMVDANKHTLTFSGAWPVCPQGTYDEMTSNAPTREFNILSLSEDGMQLLIPASGTCLNYISVDYRDNWTPPADDKPKEPTLPENWQDIVGTISQTSIKWTLSDQNPMDWCNLDGSRMNGWNAPSDYPDWLGTPDPSVYGDFSLTMDSADNSYVCVAPNGTEIAGTYTLDEKGIYTFDNGLPTFTLISWASFATTADNQLRIMEIKTKGGMISEMWLGAKSAEKEEYMAYHLIANVGAGGGTPSVPAGKVVAVNNDNLIIGDIEGNGNIRLELYNEYGAGTKDAPVVQPSDLEVVDYMDIRVTLSGIELKEGASGSYIGGVYYADADWNPQADTKNETDGTKITGDGTYTFHVPAAGASGAMVFVIDIVGLSSDLAEGAVINATIDDIVIDGKLPEVNNIAVNNANLIVGDIEGNGNIRLELYNEYGAGTKDAPVVDPSTFAVENELVIKVALNGIQLKDGAAGYYVAGVYYADADWDPQADTKNETDGTTVTGDGIYTFRVPAAGASGIMVLVVDIVGLSADLAEGAVVNAKIHSITVE